VLLRRRRTAGALYVRHDWAMAPTVVAARILGYRVVAEVNDLPYGSGAPSSRPRTAKRRVADGVKRRFAAALFRATDEVVAVTDQVAAIVRRDYRIAPARVHVIGNGVDVELFAPRDRDAAARAAGLDPDARHLAFVGLFAPWVDFPCMLEAVARVGASRPDVRLLLVGDGGERGAIEEHAARLGLDGRLVLTGFVRERDRVADLVGATVLGLVPLTAVHARIGGGSPVKLGEYMASARPVVATALPTSRALLERFDAGVAVEAGSVDEMADALAALLDDPERAAAMGEAGRRAAEDHLSWEAAVERIAVLLEPARATVPGAAS
jgi:glycosyltransferase involved in cell wall biosynthesis